MVCYCVKSVSGYNPPETPLTITRKHVEEMYVGIYKWFLFLSFDNLSYLYSILNSNRQRFLGTEVSASDTTYIHGYTPTNERTDGRTYHAIPYRLQDGCYGVKHTHLQLVTEAIGKSAWFLCHMPLDTASIGKMLGSKNAAVYNSADVRQELFLIAHPHWRLPLPRSHPIHVSKVPSSFELHCMCQSKRLSTQLPPPSQL